MAYLVLFHTLYFFFYKGNFFIIKTILTIKLLIYVIDGF